MTYEEQNITPASAGGSAAARAIEAIDTAVGDHERRIGTLEGRAPGGEPAVAFARDEDGRAFDPGRVV